MSPRGRGRKTCVFSGVTRSAGWQMGGGGRNETKPKRLNRVRGNIARLDPAKQNAVKQFSQTHTYVERCKRDTQHFPVCGGGQRRRIGGYWWRAENNDGVDRSRNVNCVCKWKISDRY